MVEAIISTAPQAAVNEVSSGASKATASSEDCSFVDALSTVISTEQDANPVQGKSDGSVKVDKNAKNIKSGKADETDGDKPVDTTMVDAEAGAIQIAMAAPVQTQSMPETDKTGVDDTSTETSATSVVTGFQQPVINASSDSLVSNQTLSDVMTRLQNVGNNQNDTATVVNEQVSAPDNTDKETATIQQELNTVPASTAKLVTEDTDSSNAKVSSATNSITNEAADDSSGQSQTTKSGIAHTADARVENAVAQTVRGDAKRTEVESITTAAAQSDQQTADTVSAVSSVGTESAGNDKTSSGQSKPNTDSTQTASVAFATQLQNADQPVSSSAATAAHTASTATEQHMQIIDQIVQQAKLNNYDGGSDLVVKLSPPELGNLKLQIVQDASGITSHIQASSENVRGLLQAHLPALMDALSNAGIKMDAVSVSVSTDSSAGSFAQTMQQGQAQSDSGQSRQNYAYERGISNTSAVSDVVYSSQQIASQVGFSWLA